MEPTLEISILRETAISPELNRAIDTIDTLAFSNDARDHPELSGIEWASHEWNALGCIDGTLVSQLCLLKREIKVGDQLVWVAGIGGVATHPHWQRRGLASQLMRAAQDFIRHKMEVPFGLLICAEKTRPLYQALGWQKVADELLYIQNVERRTLKTCVMILNLTTDPFLHGIIDLCGLPW